MWSNPIAAGEPAIDAVIIIGAAQHVRQNTEYHCGSLWLSRSQHRATRNGKPLELSHSEFVLLARLMQRPGDVVTVAALCEATHGYSTDAVEAGSLVRPLIWNLRRKIGAGMIENIRGVGYRLAV